MVIKWKSDFDKFVVNGNFERRGWLPVEDSEEDWNIWWASVGTIKSIFFSEGPCKLQPGQIVNHFPNHYELTRKDLMVKNIKRYQKQMRKEGKASDAVDIVPATYVLPQDYALFVEEFRRNPNTTWIMKPTAKSQGKGIFLINKLSQVKKWSNGLIASFAAKTQMENYVVSRYIDNPLLVGGKKFDLRLYVVVTSYKPLRTFMSDLGFGRFCNVKYSTEVAELDNMFVHLTNVAIQKHGDDYNSEHGNKWSYKNLVLFVEGVHGRQAAQQLVADIEALIVVSLKACQSVIINDKHCFELYGYDVMIDSDFKPWLIEVNASPSLTTTTATDRCLKFQVINDTLNIVTTPEWCSTEGKAGRPADGRQADSCPRRVGCMKLLYDEAAEMRKDKAAKTRILSGQSSRGVRAGGRPTVLDITDRPRSAFV